MKNQALSKVEQVALEMLTTQFLLNDHRELEVEQLLITAFELSYRFLDKSKQFNRVYE